MLVTKIIPRPVRPRSIPPSVQNQMVTLIVKKVESPPSMTGLDRITPTSRYGPSPKALIVDRIKNSDWVMFSFDLLIGRERINFDYLELIPKHRKMIVGGTISANVTFRIESHEGNKLLNSGLQALLRSHRLVAFC